MKTAIVVLAVILFQSFLYSQSKDIWTLGSGITKSRGSGVGFTSEYQTEVKERLFFVAGTGFFKWIENEGTLDRTLPRSVAIVLGERGYFIPFNVGFKYYFGEKNLTPFLTACWALNIAHVDLRKYYPNDNIYVPTPPNKKVGERTITEVTYCFGIGALYEISDAISAQFEFSPYLGGEFSNGVRFMLGAVYIIY